MCDDAFAAVAVHQFPRDKIAHRPADQHAAIDPERVEQRVDVVRVLPNRVSTFDRRRAAVAAQVRHDDAIARLDEGVDDGVEIRGAHRDTVQQHERKALTTIGHAQRDAGRNLNEARIGTEGLSGADHHGTRTKRPLTSPARRRSCATWAWLSGRRSTT